MNARRTSRRRRRPGAGRLPETPGRPAAVFFRSCGGRLRKPFTTCTRCTQWGHAQTLSHHPRRRGLRHHAGHGGDAPAAGVEPLAQPRSRARHGLLSEGARPRGGKLRLREGRGLRPADPGGAGRDAQVARPAFGVLAGRRLPGAARGDGRQVRGHRRPGGAARRQGDRDRAHRRHARASAPASSAATRSSRSTGRPSRSWAWTGWWTTCAAGRGPR